MFVFREIWRALFSCNTRFEIRPFALLPMICTTWVYLARLLQTLDWLTAWKLSKYGFFSGQYFPVLGLNKEIYGLNLRIQSEYKKMRARKNSVFGTIFTQS